MAVDFAKLGGDVVSGVGGIENIKGATHCATRLRLDLKDDARADEAAVKALPGVIAVVKAGGQFQVVIGNDVPLVHAEVVSAMEKGGVQPTEDTGEKKKRSPLDAFIELVSAIIHPILWPLAGAGLFKAFLQMFVTFGWLSTETTEYVVLNAASDSLLYFLPILLAIPAAKRFKANQYTAVAIAGALVYPSLVNLANTDGLTLFGIPLLLMNYTSSLIPIIVAVWLQGYLERFLNKYLPSAIRNFTTPLLVLLIMVPVVLLTVGPITVIIAGGIGDGVTWLFGAAPWAAGAIMGGLWQVFVIFGLHWGLVPILLEQLADGYSVLSGPLLGAVLAQSAATLAVFLRTRDAAMKELAGPAALSGFLAGITEPGIYGVNLPRRLPLYFGIVGGAIGGIFAGIAGAGTTAFVFPSLLGIPAYLSTPNLPLLFIGVGIAVAVSFLLTFFWGARDPKTPDSAETQPAPEEPEVAEPVPPIVAEDVTEVMVGAPVAGHLVPMAEIADAVFASGAMGTAVGIVPSNGTIVAPVAGKVVAAMPSGHAYGIKGANGVEVLVHIGIDTVNMKGEGFTPMVAKGDLVEAGQVLAEVDLDAIRAAGYDTTTIIVVTNTPKQKSVEAATGDVAANEPALLVRR